MNKSVWFTTAIATTIAIALFAFDIQPDTNKRNIGKPSEPMAIPAATQGKSMNVKDKTYSKPSLDKLKNLLTPLQFNVTQHEGTERAFENEYWNEKREGIYVDIVSGEPLFSSLDKFESGTGWPSFTRPLETRHIVEKTDNRLFASRTEVRSKYGDSHLGHVFEDGPKDKGGLRYCMNSAAMRFVPRDALAAEGYDEYGRLFEQ